MQARENKENKKIIFFQSNYPKFLYLQQNVLHFPTVDYISAPPITNTMKQERMMLQNFFYSTYFNLYVGVNWAWYIWCNSCSTEGSSLKSRGHYVACGLCSLCWAKLWSLFLCSRVSQGEKSNDFLWKFQHQTDS